MFDIHSPNFDGIEHSRRQREIGEEHRGDQSHLGAQHEQQRQQHNKHDETDEHLGIQHHGVERSVNHKDTGLNHGMFSGSGLVMNSDILQYFAVLNTIHS